jgi:hypothetical protein
MFSEIDLSASGSWYDSMNYVPVKKVAAEPMTKPVTVSEPTAPTKLMNDFVHECKAIINAVPKKERLYDAVVEVVAEFLLTMPDVYHDDFLTIMTRYIFSERLIYTPITNADVPGFVPKKGIDPVVLRLIQTTPAKKGGIQIRHMKFDVPKMMSLINVRG